MKARVKDFVALGREGEAAIIVKKHSLSPFYSSSSTGGRVGNFAIPPILIFITTLAIRAIDSKHLQANPFLMVLGFLIIYFSVAWFFRNYRHTEHEVEDYQFQNEEALLSFIQDSRKRNQILVNFYLIFLVVAIVTAYLYLTTNLFIFLFFSLGTFLCFVLMAKYQPIKRIFVLHKIKKELIR